MSYLGLFNEHFKSWALDACREWGYAEPDKSFYQGVKERLTEPTLAWIGLGIEKLIIRENGLRFNLARNEPKKGPYKWFSKRTDAKVPQVNWEYYVQVAYLIRIWQPCLTADLRPVFEDELMDLAVRKDGNLRWCIEVKEKAVQLRRLLNRMQTYASAVPMEEPDRGNDPLRKAKYLIKHRPPFFSGVANGLERHFKVSYVGAAAFALTEADPPLDVPSVTSEY